MSELEFTHIADKIDSKFNLLLDVFKSQYALEKYPISNIIQDYFDIDKSNFRRLLKEGIPVIKIGGRYKGKLSEIEKWFKNQSELN